MLHREFVGRDAQLHQLDLALNETLAGRCRVALVSGGAGSGKTRLAQQFAARAQNKNPKLLVAKGDCSTQIGMGAPYLPFQDILAQVTGSVEAKQAENGLSEKSATRLKDALDVTVGALLEYGPDLIGTFLPGGELISKTVLHVAKKAGWMAKLEAANESNEADKDKLSAQYVELLRATSTHYPLVLILDDLQWTDAASMALFMRILKEIPRAPILFLCVFRPNDTSSHHSNAENGWYDVLERVQGEYCRAHINLETLADTERQAFVSNYLSACPNRFPPQLASDLYLKTAGHPLFLAELIQGLEESGKIWQDGDGYWLSHESIDWKMLPSRLDGTLSQRFNRLDEGLRELLTLASVEGVTFSLPVLAALSGREEYDVLKQVARKLDRHYHLVREGGIHETPTGWLAQYVFTSTLFRQHLYESLSRRERMILHRRVASTLEALYEGQTVRIANELALHFTEAGEHRATGQYTYLSGLNALRLGAYQEALSQFEMALEALERVPVKKEDTQLRIDLQIRYCNTLRVVKGWQADEVVLACARARELFETVGATPEMGPFLFNRWASHLVNLELERAAQVAKENLALGERIACHEIQVQGHMAMGNTDFWLGRFDACLSHMQAAAQLLGDDLVTTIEERYGQDVRIFLLMFSTFAHWLLGEEAEASSRSAELDAIVAEEDNRFGLAVALQAVCWQHFHRGDHRAAAASSRQLINLCSEAGLGYYGGIARLFLGWAEAVDGSAEGLNTLEAGLRLAGADGNTDNLLYSLYALLRGLAHQALGNDLVALAQLEVVIPLVQASRSEAYLSELHRVAGELALATGDAARAKEHLELALGIARRQLARTFESRILRAMTDARVLTPAGIGRT
jgi:tetratricopeptide (TPR) repeat protein